MNEVHVYREQMWKWEPSFVFVLRELSKGFSHPRPPTDDDSNLVCFAGLAL